MVKHIIPETLITALTFLNEGTYQIMAGGTDLMIQKRSTAGTLPHFERDVLYLANLEELRYIRRENGQIHIGAMTTLEEIIDHPDVPELLKEVIREMGSPAIRHVGTLAGNIGNASPAGDSLVVLYLLDAQILLSCLQGNRTLPVEQVITGVRKTVMKPNELIHEIIIPEVKFDQIKWVKVGGRQADAISKVSFAGAYRVVDHRVAELRLAFGAIAITVIRSRELEKQFVNRTISELIIDLPAILKSDDQLISPIYDQRSNKIYRREVALNIARDFIEKIKE
ncbi:MAG: FAD binding domain-containing protein [Firmicutes bacterium]|nr:FAD binding domain-containing protein [Bacillota bacterium]